MEKQVSEGSLHKWFKGSKSKDGKGGWVNVVTGGTCASDEPGEGTPKCVSSAKRASMTKAERLSAARRKKKADPNQQQKSGAAKPTYVSTDKPKKKKMKESYTRSLTPLTEKAKKCWPGYEKKGTKKMFGKTYNNCVKKEEVELEAYSANPAQQAAIAIAKKKKKEDDMVAKKKKQSMYASYQPEKEMVDENIAARLGASALTQFAKGSGIINKDGTLNPNPPKSIADRVTGFGKKLVSGKPGDGFIGDPKLKIKNPIPIIKKQIEKNPAGFTIQNMSHEPEGETISEVKDKKGKGSGTKDACYHKVKSRYSVWPSAYASGALVKCRKVGAANWGNSSKKEDFSDWKSEFIWEDGDSSKKLEEDKSPAWQRKEGKSESGGLNAKGVASYRRENPGSKLKTAVTTKPSKLKRGSKSAKRRKSFCSRMKGMKKKLTSAKTARDPDSRINKALRKWNC